MANSKIFAPLDYLQGDNISGQTDFLEDLDYISLPIPANQYYDLEKGFELTHLLWLHMAAVLAQNQEFPG